MARRLAKDSEEEIDEAFFNPSDLVNTKTTIALRVGEERWIYTSTLRVPLFIYHIYLTIRSEARKGYGSIAHEAKPNGLLLRRP